MARLGGKLLLRVRLSVKNELGDNNSGARGARMRTRGRGVVLVAKVVDDAKMRRSKGGEKVDVGGTK